MCVALQMQKLLTFFFSKNISVYSIFNDQSFNDTLTNDMVSFEQHSPDQHCCCISNNTTSNIQVGLRVSNQLNH